MVKLISKNKKSQFTSYVAVAVLLIALSLFIIFNRISITKTELDGANAVIKNVQASQASTFIVSFPYIRVKEIPIAEFMGDAICYGSENIDYDFDSNLEFNIPDEIRNVADLTFGKDRWALKLYSNNPDFSKIFINSDYTSSTLNLPKNKQIFSYDFVYVLPCTSIFKGKGEFYVW